MAVHGPPLAARQKPGLFETLDGPRDPRRCQSCGGAHSETMPLARWLEHDAWDRVPTKPAVVVLCAPCADRLIEPHPRLYRHLDNGESFPGCMRVCVPCRYRNGVACDHADAKGNGGKGLEMSWGEKPPIHAHICGGKSRGFRWFFQGPVVACSGREEARG